MYFKENTIKTKRNVVKSKNNMHYVNNCIDIRFSLLFLIDIFQFHIFVEDINVYETLVDKKC